MSTPTSPIGSTVPTPPVTAPVATNAAAASLTPTDFLNMMVTQLQNQDPLNPTSSSDLLAQMSQIGQLQSSTTLQSSLTSFGLQTSIGTASSMIGKTVQGLDVNSNPISGVVTSVQVQNGNVSLGLDSGGSMALSNVSSITPAPATAATH
ncbi:MAG TPA: flagellar hook capping FlgD N-terminal domain-containing protein [Tepidisphaeraceae bacterium]|nr:flagellar hook capping FlgD N-terminal domain-containing protein [Tepidisphaeraceae bacterium]